MLVRELRELVGGSWWGTDGELLAAEAEIRAFAAERMKGAQADGFGSSGTVRGTATPGPVTTGVTRPPPLLTRAQNEPVRAASRRVPSVRAAELLVRLAELEAERVALDVRLRETVEAARARGATWQDVADVAGIHWQTARFRWGRASG